MLVNTRALVICHRCRRYLSADFKKSFSTQSLHLRFNRKNYYDVLGVERTATQGEIKAAYFELSKMHHPDRNTSSTDQFLEIGKAYEILGKPLSRKDYDSIMYTPSVNYQSNVNYDTTRHRTTTADPFGVGKDTDSQDFDWYKHWIYDDDRWKSGTTRESIYGIKGIPKLSDFKIVYYLIGLAIVGGFLQLVFVFGISEFRRRKFDAQSKEISLVLQDLEKKIVLSNLKKNGLVTNNLTNQKKIYEKSKSEGVDDIDSTANKFRYTYHASKGTTR